MPPITLTTDFGNAGSYVGQLKGLLASLAPNVPLVDITHAIAPQGVREGAFVLAEAAPWFPAGTVHLAVVDPGVGTERRIVCLALAGHLFVAPDNGLLSRVLLEQTASAEEPPRAFEVTNRDLFLPQVSATFHGRDIMAPLAARLATGTPVSDVGPAVAMEDLVPLPWPVPMVETGEIHGCIQAVDAFGNLITNIAAADLPASAADCTVLCHGWEIEGVVGTYGEKPAGELIALIGSGGWLELAVVGGSAAARLDVVAGEPVVVSE